MTCTLKIDDIKIENRTQTVFYSTSDYIVYKDERKIHLADCSQNILSSTACPPDCKHYEACDLGDSILFVFAGKHVVVMDKSGNEPIAHDLDASRLGRCITPVFCKKDSIVFGTFFKGNIQFVNYDFMGQKRISQTSSWPMKQISHFTVFKDNLYGILDDVFAVSCNANNCEPKWTRFEAGLISGKILFYGDKMVYGCQNVLKLADDNGGVTNIMIPLSTMTRLESIVGSHLYFIDSGTNLCCYDLLSKTLKWKLPGLAQIQDTLTIRGKFKGLTYDAMLLLIENHVVVVNLSTGATLAHLRLDGVFKMRETGNQVLLNRYNGESGLIGN